MNILKTSFTLYNFLDFFTRLIQVDIHKLKHTEQPEIKHTSKSYLVIFENISAYLLNLIK